MRVRNFAFLTIQVASTVLATPSPQASGELTTTTIPTTEPTTEPDAGLPVDLATPLLSGIPEDALQAMQDLDEAAFQQIQEALAEAENTTAPEKKRWLFNNNGCTLSKLQIRREWYVFFFSLFFLSRVDAKK